MPKGKAPVPRKLGGRREERSLIVLACRAIVENYANLLRLGLVVGGLYFIAILPDKISPDTRTAILADKQSEAENTPSSSPGVPGTDASAELESRVRSESNARIDKARKCTQRDYQRKNFSDCDLSDSEVYEQDEIFKDDGTRTIIDMDTLYADAR